MKYFSTLFCLLFTFFLSAQNNIWSDVDDSQITLSRDNEQQLLPTKYRAVSLEIADLQKILSKSPPEFKQQKGIIIPIPMPDGTMEDFEIWSSPIMEKGLADRYPNIKTYKGKSINNTLTTSRLGHSNLGFHAIIQSPKGTILIDPLATQQTKYYTSSYAKHGAVNKEMEEITRTCGVLPSSLKEQQQTKSESRNSGGVVDLYIYQAAIACSGEYAEFHNANTKEDALSHITATMNRANMIFERDLALRMVLIEETDSLIFLDKDTDPYSEGGNVPNSYQENPIVIETRISPDKFDIGHVFIAQCGGGVVGIGGGKVCDVSKSLGISCQFNSDAQFAINLVCHEMGHQLYANHSWTHCPGNEDQMSGGTAYEPGSGSTIMSYAGACGGGNNVQNSADGYYHSTNIQEILADKLSGRTRSCAEIIPTENLKPEAIINYDNGFYIPISTPFELTGDGTDENGDNLTYCWEQYNTGPSIDLGTPAGSTPIFRSFPPTISPTRVFPKIADIVNNRNDKREVLPTYSRNLTFRLTVRDNNAEAGSVDWKNLSFEVTDQAGPFLVSFPNTGSDSIHVGDFTEIKWDIANTDKGLVNCQKVNVLLSLDGGNTFPHILLENTANDGAQFVTIPDLLTDKARIRVEAANNIFFDISNRNFDILPATKTGFSFATSIQEQQVCLPATVEIDLVTIALLDFGNAISFSVNTPMAIEGSSASFTESQVSPGVTNKLILTFPADHQRGAFPVEIIGNADGATVVSRIINLDLVANQFTNFELSKPENNSSGLGLAVFEWLSTRDATLYEIEIATNPAFGAFIVDEATNIIGHSYTPTTLLDESTIYYWRVRPINDCGVGPDSEIFAFQTENLSCTNETATEVPILISSQGKPTIESKFTVTQNFIISDLNVPIIRGSHDWVSHIRTTLVSPAGTTAILFSGKCPGSVPFNIGFDDESPTNFPCPPIDARLHQPQESLSIFDGETTFGEWALQIEVLDNFGEGGSLDEWKLEFCGNITLEAPVLVTNEVLTVKPQTGRLISSDFLLAEDANNSASELIYTLVKSPNLGSLLFNNETIAVGTHFSQSDLNSNAFKYHHDTDAAEGEDEFTFTVTDGEGGWIGITPFKIILDESETTVGINDLSDENLIKVFPNPVKEIVYLEFKKDIFSNTQLDIFDIQGKLIFKQRIDNQLFTSIPVDDFENGIYFFKIRTKDGVVTKKVVVQR